MTRLFALISFAKINAYNLYSKYFKGGSNILEFVCVLRYTNDTIPSGCHWYCEKISIHFSIPIRIFRQTKGSRTFFFCYQTFIFAFPIEVTIIVCHISNDSDMLFITLALIKFALLRWVLFDEWHVDLKDVLMLKVE